MNASTAFNRARKSLEHAVTHSSHHIMMRTAFKFSQAEDSSPEIKPIMLGKQFTEGNLAKIFGAYGQDDGTMRLLGETLSAISFSKVRNAIASRAITVSRPLNTGVVILSPKDFDTWLKLYAAGQRPNSSFSNKDAKLCTVSKWTVCVDSWHPQGSVYYLPAVETVTIVEKASVDVLGHEFVWPASISVQLNQAAKQIL